MQKSASIQPRTSPVNLGIDRWEIPVRTNYVSVYRYCSCRYTGTKFTGRPDLRSRRHDAPAQSWRSPPRWSSSSWRHLWRAFFENAFFENAFFENAFFENFANFWRARSRLYQNEILQENMRSTAFFKLYKICILLHRCNLKFFAKNRFEKSAIFVKIQQKNWKYRKICKNLSNFQKFQLENLVDF